MTITTAYQIENMFEVHYDDGTVLNVPEAPGNRHYSELQEWLASDNSLSVKPAPPISNSQVNMERERRITEGTTVSVSNYGSIKIQGRDEDQRNLQGLAMISNMRIAQGNTTVLTVFRDAENVNHDLTPPQIVELWSKGVTWISNVYSSSWTIKAMDPIPQDYNANTRWPE